jgi:hypothetical protein
MPRGPHPSHRMLTAAGSTVGGRRRGRVLRHVLRCPLAGDDCRTAVEIALGEACANAVRHADPATHYEVHLRVRDATCLVEVTDAGTGFALHHQPAVRRSSKVILMCVARPSQPILVRRVRGRHGEGCLFARIDDALTIY